MTEGLNPTNNNQFRAMLERAWKQHQAGRLQAAESAYLQLLAASPGDSNTNNLMGLLQLQSRRPEQAIRYIRTALKSDPHNPQSLYNLGIACKDLGRIDAATGHFRECVALAPSNADAINALANSLRLQGQTREASKWFEKALRLQPQNPLVHCNLGYLSLGQGQYPEATKHFDRAISLQPRLAEAHNGLAESSIGQGRSSDALTHLQKALAIKPDYADALTNLGIALNKLGRTDEAPDCFEKAIAADKSHSQAHLNLGLAREQGGRLDEAARHYQQAIQARPGFADAHFRLAHLRTHQSSAAEIKAMEQLLESENDSDDERARLAFGLGFAHESCENYKQAFHFMRQGHLIQKKSDTYDANAEVNRFQATIDAFSPELFESLGAVGVSDDRPVFIVGMPRSGTTLTEQILASHSAVYGNGESTLVAKAANELSANFRLTSITALLGIKPGQWSQKAAMILDALTADAADALRVTDTSPMNFLYIGAIAVMLPAARIVVCTRDAMDNCLSIYRQFLTGPHGYAHELADLGEFYKLHARLIEHWQRVLPGKIHVLDYDRLVADPETQIVSLLDFCQLPFEQQCLSFHESRRTVKSPSASQVHQPIYTTSVGAWRKYERHLAPLKESLGLPED